MFGYKEDPFIFLKDDNELWPPVKLVFFLIVFMRF